MEFAAKPVVIMRRLIIVAAVLFWAVVVAGVSVAMFYPFTSPTRVSIADASREETIFLNAPSHWKPNSVTRLWVRVSGEIDGRAEIQVMRPNADEVGPAKPKTLGGPFNFIWKGDYYLPRIELRYTPTGTVRGQVHLDYHFNGDGKRGKADSVNSW